MPEQIFLPIDTVSNRILNADELTARRNLTLTQGESYDVFLKFLSGSAEVTPTIDEFSFLLRKTPTAATDLLSVSSVSSGSGAYPYKFSFEANSVPLASVLAGYDSRT